MTDQTQTPADPGASVTTVTETADTSGVTSTMTQQVPADDAAAASDPSLQTSPPVITPTVVDLPASLQAAAASMTAPDGSPAATAVVADAASGVNSAPAPSDPVDTSLSDLNTRLTALETQFADRVVQAEVPASIEAPVQELVDAVIKELEPRVEAVERSEERRVGKEC